MFYCREKELQKLNKRYESNEFECIIIYGRRRVGKTSLISEFCKDKPTIFFSALNASSSENLDALSKSLYEYKEHESVNYPVYKSYNDVFSEITRLSENERVVFVIDEYPYLAKAEESISSRLQHVIDHSWGRGKLFLILCGSSMSFMENQVLGYESPLYGRRTAQFKIEPLSYRDITAFNPDLDNEQQALIYGITGGVPLYVKKINVNNDVDDALLENLFETSSYLFEEPQNLLKQELREPAKYNSIITAIAGGATRLNEVSTKVGIESGICTKYIKSLLELGIVKKETPVTEKQGKKTIYKIEDNFFRFWYRFVPKNISAISTDRMSSIYEHTVKQYLSDYMGMVFEEMCRDYLMRYENNLPILLSDIGRWWGTDKVNHKEIEIDIVGTSAEGNEYIIGSCKYKSEKIGMDEFELLKQYAAVFGKGNKYHYYIFAKSGFTDNLLNEGKNGEVRLLTLDDLY